MLTKLEKIDRKTLLCVALASVVLIVYIQVIYHDFINFDDNIYVYENTDVLNGLSFKSLMWAFTAFKAGNWHPVTWLSHLIDVQMYGIHPGGHHLTSVIIHISATIILFLFLFRLTEALWQSAFVAAVFALHPQHVESVAWVSERKDVLSAFFGFLTLLFYTNYKKAARCDSDGLMAASRRYYFLALVSFVLGLMSKAMLVSIPVILLLIDYWIAETQPLFHSRSIRSRYLIEKIPFFILSAFASFLAIYAQSKGGAVSSIAAIPLWARIQNAVAAYVQYISKTLYPRDLAVLYPLRPDIPSWQLLGSLLILILISWLAIRNRHAFPYLLVGWCWFVVTLVPVIGLLQVGVQAMADRYSYIPMVGLLIMVAWGGGAVAAKVPQKALIVPLLAIMVVLVSAGLTWHQLGYWRDNISLYKHTLAATTNNFTIHTNLGSALFMKDEVDSAIDEYKKAIRIDPGHANAHYNLGFASYRKGDFTTAIGEFRLTQKINPNYPDLHFNLGCALYYNGDIDSAIRELKLVIQQNPDDVQARNLLDKWSK